MLTWLVRIVMALAGAIVGWFVARESASFGVVQMAVSLLLISLLVAAAAFWPSLVAWLRNRRRSGDGRKL